MVPPTISNIVKIISEDTLDVLKCCTYLKYVQENADVSKPLQQKIEQYIYTEYKTIGDVEKCLNEKKVLFYRFVKIMLDNDKLKVTSENEGNFKSLYFMRKHVLSSI